MAKKELAKWILPVEMWLILAAMWVVFAVDFLLPGISFNGYGIRPRTLDGLPGIILSPFLHGGLVHIVSNTVPLIVLSILVRVSVGSVRLLQIVVLGVIGSGIGTWIFSMGGLVVGASGLVYALIGFLFADAWFKPSLRSWLIAIISFVLYGGALLSLFTILPFVSWAAHFWGFVAGVLIAWLYRHRSHR